jgi:hypothetical protein
MVLTGLSLGVSLMYIYGDSNAIIDPAWHLSALFAQLGGHIRQGR